MKELIVNLHIHSTYSDGTGTHADIGNNALQAGLDVVIVTDHNVLVKGVEKYFHKGSRQVLLLVGEEVHDQDRQPQSLYCPSL
jgi:predicted metal-dependent phosphoesterase TrpH